MDSIPIRLRKVLDLGLPTDEEVLLKILRHIREGAKPRVADHTEVQPRMSAGEVQQAS